MSEKEPPLLLDGARVVSYAVLPPPAGAGRGAMVVGGVSLDAANASRLAIVEDLAADGAWLLACNERWETIAAERHANAAQARAAADATHRDAPIAWTDFRALTAEEEREVETTRAFLREIARDFPEQ